MTKTTPKTSKTARAVPKTSSAKTSKKLAAKTPVKRSPAKAKTTSAPKATHSKVAKSRKTAPKSSTKNTVSAKLDLQTSLASLETRMKRADTLTRKSVQSLEKAVFALDARTRKENTTGKAALTRRINQLSKKLTDMVEQTQSEVNAELKTALDNPTVENLRAALQRADQRLTHAEQNQSAAISKVNHHLSAIATAVDARIEDEAKTRLAAIAALKTETQNAQIEMTRRIDTIETDTAQAFASTGDKIAELSSEFTRRSQATEMSIRETVSEIALQTQTEFETYKSNLERRMEDVVHRGQDNDAQRLERSIASLTARLDGLEYAVANTPAEPQPSFQTTGNIDLTEPATPKLSLVASQAAPLAPTVLTDAFTPSPPVQGTALETMPNPYLMPETSAAPEVVEPVTVQTPNGGPVEFDPRNYTAKTQSNIQTRPPAPQEPARDFTQASLAPPAAAAPHSLPPMDNAASAMPYADPAYAEAEADPTMARVRIGGENASKFNLPKLTGRNLRVAALATGVAVVGLVAAKGVFGGGDDANTLPQTAQNTQPQNIAPVSTPKPDTSIAPIGDYADNKAVEIAPSSEEAKTLNAAASAGNKVAQFQLGLSYLEQGRTNEGVALIRKSANQNQPAAQYRLAKLYEIGEGVSQDSEMARQLTERAAANGNRIAMHDLALYYAEGRGGVTADLPTAAKWFEKAAERGVVDSQFNLGVLFESGQGLPKNVNDAFVWYSIAAAQGDQFAKTRVEVLSSTLDQTDLVSAAARAEKFAPVKIDEAANGIFRNVAWAKPAKPAGSDASQVKQVQAMLGDLGYDIGGADGAMGPKTRAAIMSFERSNSLPETGRVNTALIDRLELATGA